MIPGSVVFYKDFTFHNGQQADKLLIILNSGSNKPYIVIRTTSQSHSTRPADEGCRHERGYYFIPQKKGPFRKDTWVLLYEPYVIDASKFLKAKFSGQANISIYLEENLLRAIINCFKKSQDCSEYHLSLLD